MCVCVYDGVQGQTNLRHSSSLGWNFVNSSTFIAANYSLVNFYPTVMPRPRTRHVQHPFLPLGAGVSRDGGKNCEAGRMALHLCDGLYPHKKVSLSYTSLNTHRLTTHPLKQLPPPLSFRCSATHLKTTPVLHFPPLQPNPDLTFSSLNLASLPPLNFFTSLATSHLHYSSHRNLIKKSYDQSTAVLYNSSEIKQ